MVGPGEVAQINVINSLRVKHFRMTRWDHYGFSPIVKTAGRCLSPGRNRRPKSFSLDDEQADHFDVSGLFFRRVQQQVPDIMCDRAPAIGVTGAAICVLILECTNLGRGPRTSVLQFCICLAPIGACQTT